MAGLWDPALYRIDDEPDVMPPAPAAPAPATDAPSLDGERPFVRTGRRAPPPGAFSSADSPRFKDHHWEGYDPSLTQRQRNVATCIPMPVSTLVPER
jgi:hypothetical protein